MLFFSIIVIFLINYIQIDYYNSRSFKFTIQPNEFLKMIPFIFSIAFIAQLIIHIFKDGEDDGTELLIVSKPIKRYKIIIGRFIIIIMWILFFNLILFISYFSIIQLDKYSNLIEKANFSLSMSIGNIIVCLIASFIILFIASFLGKIGTISICIGVAAIVPILSQIIYQTTRPHRIVPPIEPASSLVNQDKLDSTIIKKLDEYNYNNQINIDFDDVYDQDILFFQPLSPYYEDRVREKIATDKYKTVSHFDLWNQWSQFYNMLLPTPKLFSPIEYRIKWGVENKKISLPKEYSIESTESGTPLFYTIQILSFNDKTIRQMIDSLKNIFKRNHKTYFITSENIKNKVGNSLPSYADVEKLQSLEENNSGQKQKAWEAFGGIEYLDLFTDKYFSFEDRIRGSDGLFSYKISTQTISMLSTLVHKFTVYATKMAKEILEGSGNKFQTLINKFKSEIFLLIDDDPKINSTEKILLKSELDGIINMVKNNATNFEYKAPQKVYSYSGYKIVNNKKEYEWKKWIDSDPINYPPNSVKYRKALATLRFANSTCIAANGETTPVITHENYLNENKIILIWTIIGIFMIIVTIFRYFKRDFK